MKSFLVLFLCSLHHSAVPARARLMEPFAGPDSEPPQNRRHLLGTSRYLDTSSGESGSGTSPDEAYNDPEVAIAALKPGDTLYLMGTVANPSYDASYKFSGDIEDPHIWHGEQTLRIENVVGTKDAPITITSYNKDTVLKGDGGNVIRVKHCEYLILDGLHIEGQVNEIAYDTAKALQFVYRETNNSKVKYRVPTRILDMDITEEERDEKIGNLDKDQLESLDKAFRPSYTDTRGIYASNCYHITISNCHVHHMPGGGIRVSYSEYVDILRNEVNDVSRKSFSGTHALVVTYAQDYIDGKKSGQAKYRARIVGNLVHNNYNEIYSWASGKRYIHAGIDEGKGISLQRNDVWEYNGRILVANNIAAYNGYSGIHSNDGDNVDLLSNTAFMNSYTTAVTYGYKRGGAKVGISTSGGDNCVIGNNLVVVDKDVKGAPIKVTESIDETNTNVHTNLVYGVGSANLKLHLNDLRDEGTNMIVANPLLDRPAKKNYDLRSQITAIDFAPIDDAEIGRSPAIGAGKPRFSIGTDYYGHTRSETAPTIGAIENPHHWNLDQLENSA